MNIASINKIPVVTAINPVLAPETIPVFDSINAVTVEVPSVAPRIVPPASTPNAFCESEIFPSLSTRPACEPTATIVPVVSKKSTNKNIKIANQPATLVVTSPMCFHATPNVVPSSDQLPVENTLLGADGNANGIALVAPAAFIIKPITNVAAIAMNINPLTFKKYRTIAINIPVIANITAGSVKSPSIVIVAGLDTIIPAFCNPM
jgi:hypothetical protein